MFACRPQTYNTHGSSPSDANEMAAVLDALPIGRVVIVATAQSGYTHAAALNGALERLGAAPGTPAVAGSFGSWVLIGRVGFPANSTEVYQQWHESGAGPTTVSAEIPLAGWPGPSTVWVGGNSLASELGLSPVSTALPNQTGHLPTVLRPGFDQANPGGWARAEQLSSIDVVAVEFGHEHTAVLSGQGKVHSLGSNAEGQLGVGTDNEGTMSSCQADFGAAEAEACVSAVPLEAEGAIASETVVAIATGQYHTLALTSGGQVWCTGANYHGECGLGHADHVPLFTRVTGGGLGLVSIVSLSAGAWHSVAISDTHAYGWGLGSSGQLGAVSELPGPNATARLPIQLGVAGAPAAVAAGDVVTLVAV